MSLNLRHKAGLFLTLLYCGVCLVSQVSLKETAGIALIGIALSWLLGSVRVTWLYYSLAVAGLLVVTMAFVGAWQEHKRKLNEHQTAIAGLRDQLDQPNDWVDYDALAEQVRRNVPEQPVTGAAVRTSTGGPQPPGYTKVQRKDGTVIFLKGENLTPEEVERRMHSVDVYATRPGKVYLDDSGNVVPVPRIVDVPSFGRIEYPGTMSNEEVMTALRQDILPHLERPYGPPPPFSLLWAINYAWQVIGIGLGVFVLACFLLLRNNKTALSSRGD